MSNSGTTTITLSRMEKVDFSVPIFVDGGSLLVQLHDDGAGLDRERILARARSQGLVAEEIDESFAKRWPFFQHNQKQIRDIEKIEHKQRRQDVLVDDELIYAYYDQHLPPDVPHVCRARA